LLRFQEAFDDTASAIEDTKRVDLFDLHVLFVVVRNVSMLLTVKAGSPSFGRATAFRDATRRYGRLPITASDYDYLTRGHLVYSRGSDILVPRLSKVRAAAIIKRVSHFFRFAWRRIA